MLFCPERFTVPPFMSLYVIRHAHALDAEEDPVRPLSKRGRKQVRALAKFLARTEGLPVAEIWHSPLARSRQTAELLAESLGLDARLVELPSLDCDEDPAILAESLRERRESLAIVGHEPHLSGLLSLLVAGAAHPPRFVVKKCAAVALARVEGVWAVRWQLSPDILGE